MNGFTSKLMKSSGQFRNDVGDPSSMQRGNQLMSGNPSPHVIYLPQHHQTSGYGGQSAMGGPHHVSRDIHGHHVHPSEMPPGSLGGHQQMLPAGMPPRRRTSGHRLSLLRDIGVAGERDRAESSANSNLTHGYSTARVAAPDVSHIIPGPGVYGGRPAMTMMSSLGGLQHLQKQQPPASSSSTQLSGAQHRQMAAASGQHSRSSSLHVYPTGSSFLLPGPTSVKSEPGSGFIKEDSKSPMHAVPSHYSSQIMRSASYSGLQQQNPGSVAKSETPEAENMPSKDSLLQAMDKVDKEIQKVTNEVKSLERKQQQLEEAAKKPALTEKSDSPKKVDTKHKDLWQVIYAENKRKAEAAKSLLDSLGPRYDMPLYNQPSDMKVYHENLKKYDLLMGEWQKRTERIENNIKRKGKETKVREFFEKQFPEIRKQREQQERFSRSGTRGDSCRSEADFNEIMDGLSEQEHQEQHMRQLAVVPPMLLDRDERRLKFLNNNGHVTEPMEDYKSVNDCVLYYYLSKKSVGYKALVRKISLKSRKVKPGRGGQQSSASSGSAQDASKLAQIGDKIDKDSDMKGESMSMIVKEEEIEMIDRPPSPRMTRSRNKNLNWSEEDISLVKEGFSKNGKDFAAISRLFTNKSELQIKHFYQSYKKKYNLDQLIGDSKKKKTEGTRRTRTQTTTPSSESPAASPIEELPTKEDSQPKSVDPEVHSAEEAPRKKKKENDSEKKEDQKISDARTVDNNALSEAESVKSTSSATSTTRRSTRSVTSTTDTNKSQATKRVTESTPAEEPTEKKAKKAKLAKDGKPDQETQINVEEENPTSENADEKDKTQPDSLLKSGATDTKSTTETEAATKVTGFAKEAEVVATIKTEPPVTTTKPGTKTSTTTAVSSTPIVSEEKPPTMKIETTTSVAAIGDLKIRVTSTKTVVEAKTPTKPHKEGDGDSSATCSADEEPNLQDVVSGRKCVDSPYAFEEESSASIKLETTRPAMTPVSVVGSVMKQPVPVTTLTEANRPSSTHHPLDQMTGQKTDLRRPQSLPAPPGAVPITTLTYNQSANMKPSHMPGFIMEKVPDESEFRYMLQNHPAPPARQEKLPSSEPCQIDLTRPSTVEETMPSNKDVEKAKRVQSVQKPHYHPVPVQATSLQKDFNQARINPSKAPEMPEQQHRKYTAADLDAMKERAAVIPVSSLRAPMQSLSRKDPVKMEHAIKKEDPNQRSGHASYQKTYPIHSSQSMLMQTHPSMAMNRSILTTSSIPTKFVTGATVSQGNPIPPMLFDPHRLEVAASLQSMPPSRDPGHFARNPALEIPPGARAVYPDPKLVPQPRTSIVKKAPGPGPGVSEGPVIISDDNIRKGKVQGSIMTGQPVQRPHDERPERMETILGKRVIVKPPPRASPVPDHARMHEAHMHGLRYPPPDIHPSHQQKRMGSILDGTPVVQRKPSDDSSSSLSPSAIPTPYTSMSRQSPTMHPPTQKHSDRRPPSEPERMIEASRGYQYANVDALKKEEPYQSHWQTTDKGRDTAPHQSAAMRRTPTGHIPQHQIKKEIPSPQTAEELMRRPFNPYEMYQMPGLPGVQRIPLTPNGVSPDFLEVIRQYGRAGGVAAPPLYPLFLQPGLHYPPGLFTTLNAMAPPGAPGSPQSDDTSKLLNQDFKTAQLMLNKAQPNIPGAQVMPPAAVAALSAAGIGIPHPIVVSAPGPYHPLAAAYQQGGLPVERLNFIPTHPSIVRSPFPSQFAQSSGRSSAENRRSPSQKPPNAPSPDFVRHRQSSGETNREFANHPAVKERNSPSSPYHSQRGTSSPHRYQPHPQSQLSPTHLQGKSYHHYPHANASPAYQPSKSPQVHPGLPPHAYMALDPNHPAAFLEGHPAFAGKLSRTGSAENTSMQKLDRARPDSAGPYVRSLPQSPNDPGEPNPKYFHVRQHSDTAKYRSDPKHEPPHLISHEQKMQSRDERSLPPSHQERAAQRESPRPKHHNEGRNEPRSMQHQSAILMNPAYHPSGAYATHPSKRDTHSPYRSKERSVDSPKQHRRTDPGNGRGQEALSSNPGEDLKTVGRTTMKAGTLINHIINLNYPAKPDSPTTPPTPTHEQSHSKTPDGGRTPDMRGTPSRSPMPFIPVPPTVPSSRHHTDKDRTAHLYSLAGPHGVTLARHSAEVIDHYYRQQNKESPSRTASPSSKPPVITEPISPDKHVVSKQDQKHAPKAPTPQFQQHSPRFMPPTEARPRGEIPSDSGRAPIVRPPLPQHTAMPIPGIQTAMSSASLEDIIREALQSSDGANGHTSNKIADFRFPMADMMISHAALASLPRHAVAAAMHAPGSGGNPAPKQSHSEERKGQLGNNQPQSVSEKYMSALMFRQSPSQAGGPPNAPGRAEHQYYQPPRPVHAMPAASQSPAPQDITQPPQSRQIHRPQYEALSDSD